MSLIKVDLHNFIMSTMHSLTKLQCNINIINLDLLYIVINLIGSQINERYYCPLFL